LEKWNTGMMEQVVKWKKWNDGILEYWSAGNSEPMIPMFHYSIAPGQGGIGVVVRR
jgi:hypothetical protein